MIFSRIIRPFFHAFLFLFVLGAMCSEKAQAISFGTTGIEYSITPIFGYDRVQVLTPYPHYSNHLIFGAAIAATYKFIGLEAIYTHGSSTDTFLSTAQTVTDTSEKLKIGLKGSYDTEKLLVFTLRAGAQLSVSKTTTTTSVTQIDTVSTPIKVDPYAGAGIIFHLTEKTYAELSGTVVFKNFPGLFGAEYESYIGYSIHI